MEMKKIAVAVIFAVAALSVVMATDPVPVKPAGAAGGASAGAADGASAGAAGVASAVAAGGASAPAPAAGGVASAPGPEPSAATANPIHFVGAAVLSFVAFYVQYF